MSVIPLDFQRRCEQRWAARFARQAPEPSSQKVMRSSDQSPSIAPPASDQDVYLVLDDFRDWHVQVWRETDAEDTDLETLVEDLLEGQYSNPVRIVAFNTAEGWSRDVSEEVAQMLLLRSAEQSHDLASSVQEFVDRYQNPR